MTDPFLIWTGSLGKIPSLWTHAAVLRLYFHETLNTVLKRKEKQTHEHWTIHIASPHEKKVKKSKRQKKSDIKGTSLKQLWWTCFNI